MEFTYGTDDTWLCPCTQTAPSFSDFLSLKIMYSVSGEQSTNVSNNAATIDACPSSSLTQIEQNVDTFGTKEFDCWCQQYLQNFDLHTNLGVSTPGNTYDLAMKGCVLIMRGLLSSTYTRRPISFVESPLAAQQFSAISARSSILAAGTPFASLLGTSSEPAFLSIEALTILMSSVYDVMINGTYAPSPSYFWALGSNTISSGFPAPLRELLEFPPPGINSSVNQASYAMPIVTFSWSNYLASCNPPYCDVIKHNPWVYRIFSALGVLGGLWTVLFFVLQAAVWPLLGHFLESCT